MPDEENHILSSCFFAIRAPTRFLGLMKSQSHGVLSNIKSVVDFRESLRLFLTKSLEAGSTFDVLLVSA